jgi:hypothetical protein
VDLPLFLDWLTVGGSKEVIEKRSMGKNSCSIYSMIPAGFLSLLNNSDIAPGLKT